MRDSWQGLSAPLYRAQRGSIPGPGSQSSGKATEPPRDRAEVLAAPLSASVQKPPHPRELLSHPDKAQAGAN